MTPGRREDRKPFTTVAVIVLSLIALLQLLRFLLRWEVTLKGAVVPVRLSGIAFVPRAKGRIKDIQTYKGAHGQDVKRKSRKEGKG